MVRDGFVAIVLHGHLPFVYHPEHDFDRFGHQAEESWFYQALDECYIPLLRVMNHLLYFDYDFRLTISLSPTLTAMFKNELLMGRYRKHLDERVESAERLFHDPYTDWRIKDALRFYRDMYMHNREVLEKNRGDLLPAFRHLTDSGKLELMACFATHGFAPNLQMVPEAVRAQIRVALDEHEKDFGKRPEGMWLPECGFYVGVDEILAQEGVKYSFLDSHGIYYGEPVPRYGVYTPSVSNGVFFFGRDPDSSKAVWSARDGYPGDFKYRDFHFFRVGGFKVGRIEDSGSGKEPYVPQWALERTVEHARDYLFNRGQQLSWARGLMGWDERHRLPVVVSLYDAELFGHWWFEGPEWIKQLFKRKREGDGSNVEFTTPSEYLKSFPRQDTQLPTCSTWGNLGDSDVWVDGVNDWIVLEVAKISEKMTELANSFSRSERRPEELCVKALNVAARETLLVQASDWPFIIKTGHFVPYGEYRMRDHIQRFYRLYEMLVNNRLDARKVEEASARWPIFTDIDYRVFATNERDRKRKLEIWKSEEPIDNYYWQVEKKPYQGSEQAKYEVDEIPVESSAEGLFPDAQKIVSLHHFAYLVPKHSDKIFLRWDLHSGLIGLIGEESWHRGELFAKLYNISTWDTKSAKPLRENNWTREIPLNKDTHGNYYIDVHASATYIVEIRFRDEALGFDILIKRTNLLTMGRAGKILP